MSLTLDKDFQVRYSNTGNNRKNTLLTIRQGDNIYFGIALLNLCAGDKWDRKRGNFIAQERALKALEGLSANPPAVGAVVFSNNRLYGACHIADIRNLLKYFDHVDELHDVRDVELINTLLTQPQGLNLLSQQGDSCECSSCACSG